MSVPSTDDRPAAPRGTTASVEASLEPLSPGVRRVTSEQLFAGCAELRVEHGDAVYRLRRTALGKLILTK